MDVYRRTIFLYMHQIQPMLSSPEEAPGLVETQVASRIHSGHKQRQFAGGGGNLATGTPNHVNDSRLSRPIVNKKIVESPTLPCPHGTVRIDCPARWNFSNWSCSQVGQPLKGQQFTQSENPGVE